MKVLREGLLFYIVGILILTLGIAITIIAGLGASPFDALLVGLNRTFGLTVGSWEIVVGLSLVLGNALIERKRPKYEALLTSLITGLGIDLWLFFISGVLHPDTWMSQLVWMMIGVVVMSLSVATYLETKIAPNPLDLSMLVISKRTGLNYTYSRAIISILLVILAFIFEGAIGIGTLVNAFLGGAFIQFFLPYVAIVKGRGVKREKTA